MTLTNRSSSRTRRSASTDSPARRLALAAWAGLWLVATPVMVGVYTDRRAGDVWGVIPAFWLSGEPTPTLANTAAGLAILATAVVCGVVYRLGSRRAAAQRR